MIRTDGQTGLTRVCRFCWKSPYLRVGYLQAGLKPPDAVRHPIQLIHDLNPSASTLSNKKPPNERILRGFRRSCALFPPTRTLAGRRIAMFQN